MRKVVFGLIVAALTAAPALAQSPALPPQVCAALTGDAGVPSADYKSGVDVNGNAVEPADLPSGSTAVPVDNFPIEINQNLAGKFNIPNTGTPYGAKVVMGYVTVRDNQAYFNGQPLNADQTAALAQGCGK